MGDSIVWILWVVLGVVLIIAEVFTPGFVLLWFGIGALAAALASMLGAGLALQFVVFIALSSLLTALSRTIFVNYFSREGEDDGLKSGAASLPGRIGTVVTSSRGALDEGAVKVFGSVWTAYPAEGEPPLEAGDRVVVERLQGASIYVRRVDSLPDWRARELPDGDTPGSK
ncbi:MAG TPA: NfeD family protein [Pyrinomonadaceae bacterium]|jgi:membrane protein implicated in regulation of membrane protease activity|nr:NfeD family protein [Pyrinomonadaceae bacterium]